jgi:phage shock protein PspC (stress-responsive transcriptional regulator)
MKKTTSANIAGVLFQIDEDAYQLLEQYLHRIEASYNNASEGKEIIIDLETRLAELFNDRTQARAKIITLSDVNWAISIIGRPENIGAQKKNQYNEEWQQPNYGYKTNRRLYRYPENRVIGGVCSGLGIYFDIDPVLLRVAFVVLLFVGFGPLAYIILWIVVPKAKTVSQKLELHGLPPTPENIRIIS